MIVAHGMSVGVSPGDALSFGLFAQQRSDLPGFAGRGDNFLGNLPSTDNFVRNIRNATTAFFTGDPAGAGQAPMGIGFEFGLGSGAFRVIEDGQAIGRVNANDMLHFNRQQQSILSPAMQEATRQRVGEILKRDLGIYLC